MTQIADFTPVLREEYLANIRSGMMRGAAGEALGLERFTVLGYIADHPEFEIRVLDAEEEALEHIDEAIYQAGASGNFPAAKLWIERHEQRKAERLARRDPLRLEAQGEPEGAAEAPRDTFEDALDRLL